MANLYISMGRLFVSKQKGKATIHDEIVKLCNMKNMLFPTGAGTGVPFHFHGPGFGEVIYGRKVEQNLIPILN